MATKVSVAIQSHPLSREENGVTFEVKNDDGKLGELIVSKGGVRWKPKGKQDHYFASWKKFDSIMVESNLRKK